MITYLIATIAYYVLLIFFLLMWARFVLDLAQSFSRGWRPKGPVLVLAEVAYTVTDPPIRRVRKILPPVRLGSVALDFGWSIIMLAVIILMSVASNLRTFG
ncbi:YggT family protein [Frigoribacterium sp. PhB24]|uniref:YggT family protein n=1 Tax=Frigoribacterium sp. PhB24 TaxID=2485204 RepID=UPI000F4A3A16|nr:YggT family protein [Frigoribacterium sp. PhB24]ROS54240.1 YggT family protein [Frigoribacterium sp. PhB24]